MTSKKKLNNDMPPWLRIDDNGRILLRSEKAGEFFGVTDRTLRDWEEKGCPKTARGWWDIQAVMGWRGAGEESLNAQKLKAEVEYRQVKAEHEQLKLEEWKGQYIRKETIAEEWSRRVIEVKKGLLALARKITSQVPDPELRPLVERLIDEEVNDMLNQYSRDGTYTPKKK